MTQAIRSPSASLEPTRSFEAYIGDTGEATSRAPRCPVVVLEDFTPRQPPVPAKHTTIGQLVADWQTGDQGRAALENGRRWVADALYDQEGETVRALRLRRGWSQTRLAEALGTSQSHIARIERGRENLTIATCRKLASVLEIDLNTLNQALERQEAIAAAKQK